MNFLIDTDVIKFGIEFLQTNHFLLHFFLFTVVNECICTITNLGLV